MIGGKPGRQHVGWLRRGLGRRDDSVVDPVLHRGSGADDADYVQQREAQAPNPQPRTPRYCGTCDNQQSGTERRRREERIADGEVDPVVSKNSIPLKAE